MSKIRNYFPILSIISISLFVYLNALENGFVWDDMVLIVDNEGIKKWSYLWKNFASDFFDTTEDLIEFKYGYYRPIISLSYMVDYAIWGLKPGGFHFSNIIFHSISSILVFLILNSIFKNRCTAFLASLLFACHPIHTESVTWISGRTDVVAGMFFLSAFYLYQKAIKPPSVLRFVEKKWQTGNMPDITSRSHNTPPCEEGGGGGLEMFRWFSKQGKIFYVCSVTLFAIAMLCKEMVATLPLLIIAYTYYFPDWKHKKRFKISLLLSIPYFLVLIFYSVIRFVVLKISTIVNPGGEEMRGLYPTILSFIKTIVFYLFKLAYPLHLSAYIQNPMSFSVKEPLVVLSILFVIALVFCIVWLRKRWACMSFLILFYLVTLLPLSNFIRISAPWDMGFVMAERFLYIPSVGFCGLTAALVSSLWKIRINTSSILKYSAISLIMVLLIFYSTQTLLRNKDWVNEKTFFLETLKDTPDAALLYHALGNVYVREQNYDRALALYKKSLALYPFYHAAYNNIGTIYSKFGLYDQAIAAFKEAIVIDQGYIQAHFNLGTMYHRKGMIEEATSEYKKVIKLSNRYTKAHNNLGIIYAENKQLEEAVAEFEMVLKYDPDNEKTRNNLAMIKEELTNKSVNK